MTLNIKTLSFLFFAITIGLSACKKENNPVEENYEFVGTDGDWFNAENWSKGQLPGPEDDVVLNDGAQVVIDPAVSSVPIVVNNITISDASSLTTLPNTVLTYNQMTIDIPGGFEAKSSVITGDELVITNPSNKKPWGGMKLNPTTNDNRSIKISPPISSVSFKLGGRFAASAGNVGVGFYANLSGDDVELNGNLDVDTIYGYVPSIGEQLQIVSVENTLTGTFANYAEGDIVKSIDGIDLVIPYVGGDGNDVVLIAQ